MTARELFNAGRLTEALKAAVEEVKRKPGDLELRAYLGLLLCFAGDWERADKQLDVLYQEASSQAAGIALFRQLIRAEIARHDFYLQGRVPEFLTAPGEHIQAQLKASIELREGNATRAAELLDQVRSGQKPRQVISDGVTEQNFFDLDDLCAPVLEVLTSTGKFYWVPLESVKLLEFSKRESARDWLWHPAELSVHAGPDGHVYIPSLYAGTCRHADDEIRLGRATEWTKTPPFRGVGMRLFQVGPDVVPMTELKRIEFAS